MHNLLKSVLHYLLMSLRNIQLIFPFKKVVGFFNTLQIETSIVFSSLTKSVGLYLKLVKKQMKLFGFGFELCNLAMQCHPKFNRLPTILIQIYVPLSFTLSYVSIIYMSSVKKLYPTVNIQK